LLADIILEMEISIKHFFRDDMQNEGRIDRVIRPSVIRALCRRFSESYLIFSIFLETEIAPTSILQK
jgi:hypothetical protein